MIVMGSHRYQSGPTPGRRLGSHPRRTGKSRISANYQNVAKIPLMGGSRSSFQKRLLLGPIHTPRRDDLVAINNRRYRQRSKTHFSAIGGSLTRKHPLFETYETDGCLGRDRNPQHLPGIGMQAGGNIQSQLWSRVSVHLFQRLPPCPLHRPLQPGSEHTVDDNIGGNRNAGQGTSDATGIGKCLGSTQCIPRQTFRISQLKHACIEPILQCQSGQNVTITPVIANTANNADPSGRWPAPPQQIKSRGTGTFHEGKARNAVSLNGGTIQCTHLNGTVQGMG